MRAYKIDKYGPPETLRIVDVPIREPGADEVLVKVHAASVNDWDWSVITGKPYLTRLISVLFPPKIKFPGVDIAGTVEKSGASVTRFRPGDKVHGDLSSAGFGGFAEYVCVKTSALTRMPGGMSMIEAAALPHAGMLALQGLELVRPIEDNQSILVNGAGGGVGVLAVQIARAAGVSEITGVDHGAKFDVMRACGYTRLIDYTKDDFTALGERYDLVLDVKTNRSPRRYLNALNADGAYVTVGGDLMKILSLVVRNRLFNSVHGPQLRLLALDANAGMEALNGLYEQGMIQPVIEGPFAFTDLPTAIRRFGEMKHRGKIVITIP